MTIRDHFVYWLFDADGTCLYVGCTKRPEQRWRQHSALKKEMVAKVATRRMSGPYTFGTARKIEREQQYLLNPTFDRRIAGWKKAKETRARTRHLWAAS